MLSGAPPSVPFQFSVLGHLPWNRENACILVLFWGVGVARVCLQQSWAWQVPTTGLAISALWGNTAYGF